MESDTTRSPVISDPPASPTRRSFLSLLAGGALAGSLGRLVPPDLVEARKKHKRKKKKKGKNGGSGNKCTGSVNGSASAAEEADLLNRINQFRADNGGLPSLARQAQLDNAAVAHSRDMATRCFFDHVNPDGADPGDRIAATGYQANAWAENIYKGSGSLSSASAAFDAWKNSPPHRANMLSTDVTQIGIGTALDSSGFMIWTNVFGRPAT
jgi:uncharacterized protein YkwD